MRFALIPFDPCDTLRVSASVERAGGLVTFTYEIDGDIPDVAIPSLAEPSRTDGLWQHTCFEAFVSAGETGYIELNFSPSGQWAAYAFKDYRMGMRELDLAPPGITFADNLLTATVALAADSGTELGLSAVIEHRSGVRSYWALAHPDSNRPDFHARDCFVAQLP